MRLRADPPIVVKAPPAYTDDPLNKMVVTSPFALGFHEVARPVVAFSAAIRFRGWPPMVEKRPLA